jgi:hypothetical protein
MRRWKFRTMRHSRKSARAYRTMMRRHHRDIAGGAQTGAQQPANEPQNIPVRVVRHRLRVTPARWESGPWA